LKIEDLNLDGLEQPKRFLTRSLLAGSQHQAIISFVIRRLFKSEVVQESFLMLIWKKKIAAEKFSRLKKGKVLMTIIFKD
jgi:hypothetical protein